MGGLQSKEKLSDEANAPEEDPNSLAVKLSGNTPAPEVSGVFQAGS